MQQLKAKLLAQLAEAIDQLFLQTVELSRCPPAACRR